MNDFIKEFRNNQLQPPKRQMKIPKNLQKPLKKRAFIRKKTQGRYFSTIAQSLPEQDLTSLSKRSFGFPSKLKPLKLSCRPKLLPLQAQHSKSITYSLNLGACETKRVHVHQKSFPTRNSMTPNRISSRKHPSILDTALYVVPTPAKLSNKMRYLLQETVPKTLRLFNRNKAQCVHVGVSTDSTNFNSSMYI